ncbi:ArsR/SmtB family transcription factor [Paludibaculum fermentans]|uniref:ArsR/SmtB family transcription factor n=1 Tax=Paludibaculum fermentans TaxID=1473598 RepID=UPI003EB70D03
MRPLLHPSVDEITVESILHALADPVRVAIYASLFKSECAQTCTGFLAGCGASIPKSTLSQHYKVLREAGLIRSERRGVEMHNTTRCAEIESRFPGLLFAILTAHNLQQERKVKASAALKRKGGSAAKGQ